MKNYFIKEHTADICLRVFGKTFKELLENAARGMMEIIVDISNVESSEILRITSCGETREELLINWLQDILYYHRI